MADEAGGGHDVADKERQMREHEREAREREPVEDSPEERSAGEPGAAPVIPTHKSPGS